MTQAERDRLADAVIGASRALVAIAVRSMAAGTAQITVAQHRVLVLLEERESLSVSAVGARLGVDQSNASRHCARLEHLGLVTRSRASRDGRAVDVRLTPAGHRQVQVVREARRREIDRVLAGLPDSVVREVTAAFEVFDRAAASASD
jgi:DNA-binding MarR family transcriptional regulator